MNYHPANRGQLSTTEPEPQRGPMIQKLTIRNQRELKTERNCCLRLSYTLVSSPDAPAVGKSLPESFRPRTETFSSLTGCMALQDKDKIGETCQYVPAHAGLRRFYACAICNNRVPPSMPLTRHPKAPLTNGRNQCHERCNSDPHPTPEIRSRG